MRRRTLHFPVVVEASPAVLLSSVAGVTAGVSVVDVGVAVVAAASVASVASSSSLLEVVAVAAVGVVFDVEGDVVVLVVAAVFESDLDAPPVPPLMLTQLTT